MGKATRPPKPKRQRQRRRNCCQLHSHTLTLALSRSTLSTQAHTHTQTHTLAHLSSLTGSAPPCLPTRYICHNEAVSVFCFLFYLMRALFCCFLLSFFLALSQLVALFIACALHSHRSLSLSVECSHHSPTQFAALTHSLLSAFASQQIDR